jgi:hypothetical protein
MKDLLIFFGEYRNFDVIIPQLKNLDKFDIVFSTWNFTKEFSYVDKCPEKYLQKDISEEDILKYIPSAKVIISKREDKYFNNTTNMIYHWKTAISEIDGDKYNRVFLHRCDMISTFDIILDENFEDNTIYLQSEGIDTNGLFINDYLFAGNFNIMKHFINSFDLDESYVNHYSIGEVITKMNFSYKDIRTLNNVVKYELARYDHRMILEQLNNSNIFFFDLNQTDEVCINYRKVFKKN